MRDPFFADLEAHAVFARLVAAQARLRPGWRVAPAPVAQRIGRLVGLRAGYSDDQILGGEPPTQFM